MNDLSSHEITDEICKPLGIFICKLVRPLSKNLFYSILSKVSLIMSKYLW